MYRAAKLDFIPEIEVFRICCLRDVILKIERDLSNSVH